MNAATAGVPRREGQAGAKDYASLATHVTLPTYPRFQRLGDRPSTPKGVGREAPLTACPRGATDAGRSAGSDSVFRVNWCGLRGGLEREKRCGLGVRSHLALRRAWGSFQNPDQPESPSLRQHPPNSGWSAFWNDLDSLVQGGCGRWARRAHRSGITRSGGRFQKTKRERNEGELRLHCGWWSQ